MFRPAAAILGIALLATCLSREAAARQKPFDVPEAEFFSRVHKVLLAPCRFPASFNSSDTLLAREDEVRWQIDSLLVQRLGAAGLEVVSARDGDSVYARIVDSVGGVFDAATGESDSAKFEFVENRVRAILRERHRPDAWVFPRVFETTALFSGGRAAWHGVSERMIDESFGKGFMKALTLRTSDREYDGQIGALSLFVPFVDDGEKPLYSWSGGIQTTARVRNGKFVPLPLGALLLDPEKNAAAVDAALKAFDQAARKVAARQH